MKRILLVTLVLAVTAICASAQNIEAVWNNLSQQMAFSKVDLPKEASVQKGFDNLSVAISETITPQVMAQVKQQVATLPAEQKLTEVDHEGKYVVIYAQQLPAGKTLVFLVIVNQKEGMLLKGITDTSKMGNAVQGLDVSTIFG